MWLSLGNLTRGRPCGRSVDDKPSRFAVDSGGQKQVYLTSMLDLVWVDAAEAKGGFGRGKALPLSNGAKGSGLNDVAIP